MVNNGGPAFPRILSTIDHDGEQMHTGNNGMTLRDYFAAKAMTGLIAGSLSDGSHPGEDFPKMIALISYKLADSMLEERSKDVQP